MKKILIILFPFFLLLTEKVNADPQYTQFYSAPMYLSPSFTGATQQHRIGSAVRNQWRGIPGGYTTYMIYYDRFFLKSNSGLGIMLLRDQAGSGQLGSTHILLGYSFDFKIIENWHARPGLSFSYSNYSVNFNKLIFSDQITKTGVSSRSATISSPDDSKGDIDAGTSLLIYTSKFWSGFTFDHLFQPNSGFYSVKSYVPIKLSVFGGFQITKRSRLLKPLDESVSIAYLYRQQRDYKQIDLGLYWFQVPFVMGLWYRGIPIMNYQRGDAIAALVGYKTKTFSIGYSYDFTISNLLIATQGAHELTLNYQFQTTRRAKKIHAIPCPEF